MVEQKVAPDEYLKRFGVSHLLEGTVRRDGQQVLVSVSLSRTSDGVAIWQKMFRGRMGEPFGLQDAIANGIEGNLRSRLAPQGGRRAEQIATTPEVYGLYSEARTLIASREREGIKRAEALLRQAVKTDPNYAPAWALLGAAIKFNGRMAIANSVRRAEALAAVKRALAFAPKSCPGTCDSGDPGGRQLAGGGTAAAARCGPGPKLCRGLELARQFSQQPIPSR